MPLANYLVVDAMHRDVATLRPEQSLRDALRDIGSTPHACFVVTDGEGHPVGILTGGDLIRLVLSEQVPGGRHLRHILATPEALVEHLRSVRAASGDRIASCMSTPVVTVDESATLKDVAELLDDYGFWQLPVVREGRLVGLIRRIDILEPLMRVHDEVYQERHADS